ncbi:MAG: hypothetical protein MUD01_02625 [Chloroflexaceae bacterium]|jgi:hypothetical protein|nr:hypothetical protein [Chloroflexaceae bacterium]
MGNSAEDIAEELEGLRQIRRIMRKRRSLLEQQLAVEGLQARPQVALEIETTAQRIKLIDEEISLLEGSTTKSKAPAHNQTEPPIPEELKLDLMLRRSLLSLEQIEILRVFESHALNRKRRSIKQEIIEKQFGQYSKSEIYYRLENLRLLGFLEIEKYTKSKNGVIRIAYKMTDYYEHRLRDHITHHDIKPGNIFVERFDTNSSNITVKLSDLGFLQNSQESPKED